MGRGDLLCAAAASVRRNGSAPKTGPGRAASPEPRQRPIPWVAGSEDLAWLYLPEVAPG